MVLEIMSHRSSLLIRHGEARDLAAIVDIYNHYIRTTPITFDLEPYTVDARRSWFEHYHATGRHQLFVGELDGNVVGYACSSQFRTKAAYDPSIETSVYIRHGQTGHGYGAQLYHALFTALACEDIHRAYAGITIPNHASIKLHERFLFETVAHMREVGRKFDKYWDVVFMEKAMERRVD